MLAGHKRLAAPLAGFAIEIPFALAAGQHKGFIGLDDAA
jgi:hypothetical protein